MRGPRRGIPWGLLGGLILVLLAEAAFSARPEEFGYSDAGDWKLAARAARIDAPGCDVLFFGDSTVKLGLQPAVLSEATGCRVYNLAVSSGPPAASHLLLERALAAGARPKAVVVDFHPHLLTVGPRHTVHYWRELLTIREALALAAEGRDAGLFAEVMLERHLPSLRGRSQVRSNVLLAIRGDVSHRGDELHMYWRNWKVNRGALLVTDGNRSDGSIDVQKRAELLPNGWTLDPVAVAHTRQFLELAEVRGIAVYWIIPPLVPALEAGRAASGLSAKYDALVERVLRRFPGVTVLDARPSGYPADVFSDPVHLNRRGSTALTLALAGRLAADWAGRSDRARRETLVAYREPDAISSLEDNARSWEIVRASGGGLLR